MSTNLGKDKLRALIKHRKKGKNNPADQKTEDRQPPADETEGTIAVVLDVPNITPKPSTENKPGTSSLNPADTDTGLDVKQKRSKSSRLSSQRNIKKASSKGHTARFREESEPCVGEQLLRSPSRLGYREDIPIIVEGQAWENTSQDSTRDDFQLQLDLKGITGDQEHEGHPFQDPAKYPHGQTSDTQDNSQQTDFPASPSSPFLYSGDGKNKPKKQFVTSHNYLNEKGSSPKHPYEKTVFYVKTVQDQKFIKNGDKTRTSVTQVSGSRPISSPHVQKTDEYLSQSTRVDSGYSSRPETIRISGSPHKPTSGKSTTSIITISDINITDPDTSPVRPASARPISGVNEFTRNIISTPDTCTSNITQDKNGKEVNNKTMSYYATTDIMSPRKQEKEELQQLNDRFSSYVTKVRQLSEQNNRLDAGSFIKQTRILEEEVASLKCLYERELDVIRQELNATSREKNNYQIQCDKNRQAAIDFEGRLSVETDKNRRLLDDINLQQQKISNLEMDVLNLRSVGDGRTDFQLLQREMDKIIRENEDHKRRQEQESLLRNEAEDSCHTLTKKLQFNEQVHSQQMSELRERFEQSQATIISLESRLREATNNDIAVPEVLKQVREQAEMELKRYQVESEETYNRNICGLKCQMDNDANTIERLQGEKSSLQGQIGELNARIRNLEGQIMTLDHQRGTAEDMISQERGRSATQIIEMEKKLRDMQELVFVKMRETSTARDLHIPLKAEIEAMRLLLEEEEKRLQSPLHTSASQHVSQSVTYTPTIPLTLPAVPTSAGIHTQDHMYSTADHTTTQHYSPLDTPFVTQSAAHNHYTTSDINTTHQDQLFTHVPLPNVSDSGAHEYIGASKYSYETTPSVNRLQIESPPRNSPRVVGPITGPIARAKSAPVQRIGSGQQLVPTTLGQGKDYFDEMFRDLTRETLYTQTRPKTSPTDRPERPPSAAMDRPPSRTERQEFIDEPQVAVEPQMVARPPSGRPKSSMSPKSPTPGDNLREATERPLSSVFHDYTTSTASAVGDIKILEVNQDGKFVRLVNEGMKELEFGGYMIQQNVGGHPVAVFRFPPRTKFTDQSTITVWSDAADPIEHQPPKDFVWKEQQRWGTGPECTTILCKPNGQAIAWMTAAHRFTKNPYEDTISGCGSPVMEETVPDTGNPVTTQDEILTEMNVNLNEPKPDPVYLRREKQCPPSLNAQKHPHGTSPGAGTHPYTGQSRPLTYGNDNSSVNRQSRVQSTRPDPIQGQPYAGGSGNRIGSAPLRKYTTSSGGNIRGSGAIANRSNPGITSEPPNAFQTPHNRFDTALEQIQSQHHVDFLPPMPRPPLFSTW